MLNSIVAITKLLNIYMRVCVYMQAFFSSGKGEPMIDHKSDVWSGSVTMMNVLVGKGAKWESHDQVFTMCYRISFYKPISY